MFLQTGSESAFCVLNIHKELLTSFKNSDTCSCVTGLSGVPNIMHSSRFCANDIMQ